MIEIFKGVFKQRNWACFLTSSKHFRQLFSSGNVETSLAGFGRIFLEADIRDAVVVFPSKISKSSTAIVWCFCRRRPLQGRNYSVNWGEGGGEYSYISVLPDEFFF